VRRFFIVDAVNKPCFTVRFDTTQRATLPTMALPPLPAACHVREP
jgi:hypothetical protein